MFVRDFDSLSIDCKILNSRQSTASDAQEVLNRAALIDRR